MDQPDLREEIAAARKVAERMLAALDNATMFAGERRGRESALRLLRDTGDEAHELRSRVLEVVRMSPVHSIPDTMLELIVERFGIDPHSEVAGYTKTFLRRAQSGVSVAAAAHKIGLPARSVRRVLADHGLPHPTAIMSACCALTAVALLSNGAESSSVARTVGFGDEYAMSAFLDRSIGLRITDARVVSDIDALVLTHTAALASGEADG